MDKVLKVEQLPNGEGFYLKYGWAGCSISKAKVFMAGSGHYYELHLEGEELVQAQVTDTIQMLQKVEPIFARLNSGDKQMVELTWKHLQYLALAK